MYTDASKTNTGVGIAIIYNNLSTFNRLLEQNSIYTAEYIALIEGVKVVTQSIDSNINICTDSLSTLNNIKYNFHSSTLAIKIGNLIHKYNKNIRFIWTPGHCGIFGNEKADEITRLTVNIPWQKYSLIHP